MKVIKLQHPNGTLVRFEDEGQGHVCLKGGVREFLVSIDQTTGKCVVKLFSGTDQAAELIVWDDSHEDLFAHEKEKFTSSCLDWLEEQLLLTQLDHITEIEVVSEAGFSVNQEPLRMWAGNLVNKFKRKTPCL